MAASPVPILGVPCQRVLETVNPAATHGPVKPYDLTAPTRTCSISDER